MLYYSKLNIKEAWKVITDNQFRRLKKIMNETKNVEISALKAGMSEKTARKYLKTNILPSQSKKEHTWRTREDPFEKDWKEIEKMLSLNPGLEAKYYFKYLQRENPGKYSDGQLRTFQRRVKIWRATKGPSREVFFPQKHYPGKLCESDFTSMNKLNITINGEKFNHLIYHFSLTYSNWETGTICFSESYESLSEGLQNALHELGGVPKNHRTDRLSAAVHKECNPNEFTPKYEALLKHYGLTGQKIRAGKANENGDIEQSHNRFKKALEQELLIRGNRNFRNRSEYNKFIQKLFKQLNSGRKKRFKEELKILKALPSKRLDDCSKMKLKIGKSSTINVKHNTYSVHSRLIKEWVNLRIYAEYIEVWYGQKKVDTLPRIKGDKKHVIQYRHIIDWLIRKPGAFNDYRYRDELFPNSYFRMAYDNLSKRHSQNKADKEYLKILYLSAYEGEWKVEILIKNFLENEIDICSSLIKKKLAEVTEQNPVKDIKIPDVNLTEYDSLFTSDLNEEVI